MRAYIRIWIGIRCTYVWVNYSVIIFAKQRKIKFFFSVAIRLKSFMEWHHQNAQRIDDYVCSVDMFFVHRRIFCFGFCLFFLLLFYLDFGYCCVSDEVNTIGNAVNEVNDFTLKISFLSYYYFFSYFILLVDIDILFGTVCVFTLVNSSNNLVKSSFAMTSCNSFLFFSIILLDKYSACQPFLDQRMLRYRNTNNYYHYYFNISR